MSELKQEIDYQVIRKLHEEPAITQRELSRRLGVSLGKINYVLNALIGRGWIKAVNFKNSNNKRAYLYQLTPHGIAEKARITADFLRIKTREYEQLQQEIARLREEVAAG